MVADLHLGGRFHLYGICIRRHLRDCVSCRRGGNSSVAVIHIGTLSGGRENKSEAGIVTYYGTLAALYAVGIGEESVIPLAVEREREVEEQAAVCIKKSLNSRRNELIITHGINIAVVAVEAHSICAARHLAG